MKLALVCTMIGMTVVGATLAESTTDEFAPDLSEVITRVRLGDDRIEYSGLITHDANAGVFSLYQSAEQKPRALLIESRGGNASAGMELGTWLHENGVDVQIDTYCFSSCANYVFPAGRTRLLAPHASLMWHGGVTQPITPEELDAVLDEALDGFPEDARRKLLEEHSREELLEEVRRSLRALIARETEFFRTLGVDQRITMLGHMYEHELLQGKGYYIGWDFSIEDMERLGIRDIRVKGGEAWEPRFPVKGQQIYRIQLDELPGFRQNFEP